VGGVRHTNLKRVVIDDVVMQTAARASAQERSAVFSG